MASNNRNAKQWLVGKVTGLQPYSEQLVVGASGKLESVESPTLQREDVRRISELEVLSKAGVRYKCVPAKLGLKCRPIQPVKR